MVARWLMLLCLAVSCADYARAGTLRIAVSSNFSNTLQVLVDEFRKQHPHQAKISSAATAVLYQQIRHGAPFDMFFSADAHHAKLLEQHLLVTPSFRHTYAYGQLALWSNTQTSAITLADLKNYHGRIAIASPQLAPYGLAAKQVLENMHLWDTFKNKLITGNNVNQTYQQTLTGAVAFGFICYSQLISSSRGQGVLIDHGLHHPLDQQMVVLKGAQNKPLAKQFFDFVLSPKGQSIISDSGYLPSLHGESLSEAGENDITVNEDKAARDGIGKNEGEWIKKSIDSTPLAKTHSRKLVRFTQPHKG